MFSSCLPCEDLPRTTIISVAVPTFEVGICHTFLVYPWKMFSRYSFCSKEDLFCIHIDEKSGDSLPRCACFSDFDVNFGELDKKIGISLSRCYANVYLYPNLPGKGHRCHQKTVFHRTSHDIRQYPHATHDLGNVLLRSIYLRDSSSPMILYIALIFVEVSTLISPADTEFRKEAIF